MFRAKNFLVLGLLVATACLFVFRDFLTQRALSFYVPRYCEVLAGGAFQYDRFEPTNGGLVYIRPRLEGRAQKGWSAEQMTISHRWDWARAALTLNIHMEAPKGALSAGSQLAMTPGVERARLGPLALHVEVYARGGVLDLIPRDSEEESTKLYFSADGWDPFQKLGSLQLSLTGEGGGDNSCALDLKGDAKEGKAVIAFRRMDMEGAYPLLKRWLALPDSAELSAGTVDGQLKLGWKEGEWFSDGESVLSLHELRYRLFDRRMRGRVAGAQLVMEPDRGGKGSIATLHMVEGGEITLYRGAYPHTTVNDLLGEVALLANGAFSLDLRGTLHQDREPRKLRLSGSLCLEKGDQEALDLQVHASSEARSEFLADLHYHHPDPMATDFSATLSHLGATEWEALELLFASRLPQLSRWRLTKGNVDGTIQLRFTQGLLTEGRLERLFCHGIAMQDTQWDMVLACDTLAGDLSFAGDAETGILKPEGSISLSDGSLRLSRPGGKEGRLDDLDADLNFAAGVLERSGIRFKSRDLQGVVDLDWPSAHEVLRAKLTGSVDALVAFLPGHRQEAFQRALGKEQVTLTASAARAEVGLAQLMGVVQVSPPGASQQDMLHFGFNLYHQANGAAPSEAVLSRPEFSWAGLMVKDGWFWTQHLPLQKYLEPLLPDTRLSGEVDLSGDFGGWELVCRFNGRQLALETSQLRAQMAKLGSDPEETRCDGDYQGSYRMDFLTGSHRMELPLLQADVEYKPRHIWLTSLDGNALLDRGTLTINGLSGEVQGVHVEGGADLDLSRWHEGEMALTLRTSRVSGRFSGVQRFLSQLGETGFSRFPLEGIFLSDEPAALTFILAQDLTRATGEFKGKFRSGSLAIPLDGVVTSDLGADFEYDLQDQALQVRRLSGRLLVGEGMGRDEYTLRAEKLRFYGFPESQAEFDVRLEGRTEELARLVGNTSRAGRAGSGEVNVVFDNDLTHLGAIQPNVRRLSLRDWSHLVALEAEPKVEFSRFIEDCHQVVKPLCGALTVSALESVRQYPLGGRWLATIKMNELQPRLLLEARGDHIQVGDRQFSSCVLSAVHHPDRWVVEQLMLDDLSLSLDISLTKEGGRVNFGGIRYQEALLAGIEGQYDAVTGRLDGFLNLLEVDFSHKAALPSFLSASTLPTQGIARVLGAFSLELQPTPPYGRITADLRMEGKGLAMDDWMLPDFKDVVCHVASDQGLTINRLQLRATPQEPGMDPIDASISRLEQDFTGKKTSLEEVRFRLPAKNLSWLAQNLQRRLGEGFNPRWLALLTRLKSEGAIEGVFSGEWSPLHHHFRFSLADDLYHLPSGSIALNDVRGEADNGQIRAEAAFSLGVNPYTAKLTMEAQGARSGVLTLLDPTPSQSLAFHWEETDAGGFTVNKVAGRVRGLEASLAEMVGERTQGAYSLGGRLRFDCTAMASLLPQGLGDAVRAWGLGAGYELSGKWTIPREEPWSLTFAGVLGGSKVATGVGSWDHLFAHVDIRPGEIEVHQLKVSDQAGELQIPEVTIALNPLDQWEIRCPALSIKDLRPALLQGVAFTCGASPSLVVSAADLRDIRGRVDKLATYRGKGELSFTNPSQDEQSPLVPVTGQAFYELRGGKLTLTRVREMFCQGRAAQFQLDEEDPSYLTVDGRLFMNFRLQRKGLFFDDPDPEHLTVRGTLAKPVAVYESPMRPLPY